MEQKLAAPGKETYGGPWPAGHLSARSDFLTSGQAEGEKGWLETIMIVSAIRSASG